MRIIIDGFGGDNAPLEVLKGSLNAKSKLGVDITVVGNEENIRKCALDNNLDISALNIHHADTVMEVCEDPKKILKEFKNSSMAVGLQLLKDGEGDAFVSAGSTGALVMGATFIVKRLNANPRRALYDYGRRRKCRGQTRNSSPVCNYGLCIYEDPYGC